MAPAIEGLGVRLLDWEDRRRFVARAAGFIALIGGPTRRLQPAQPVSAFSRVRYHFVRGLRG